MRFATSLPSATPLCPVPTASLIDITFLLLTFFLFSLKLHAPEGEFLTHQLPVVTDHRRSDSVICDFGILHLHLQTMPDGRTKVLLGDRVLGIDQAGLDGISTELRRIFPLNSVLAWDVDVVIHAGHDVPWQQTVTAVSRCSFDRDPVTGVPRRLCEKIEFAAPRD
jgi:hypothetical protein